MLVPRTMPVDLAWVNARYGAPVFGPFAASPPSEPEVAAWAMSIPWALNMLGPTMGKVALVLPPTLPGVAWMIRDGLAIVELASPRRPAWLDTAWALLQGGVQWAGPLSGLPAQGPYSLAVRLSPCEPPPSAEELDALATLLRPGCVLALAFAVEPGNSLVLPLRWRPSMGDTTVIPGLGDFDEARFRGAVASSWMGAGVPIGVLSIERCP